ncbi:Zinc knuckle [Popillia japonica]|uniref:Zinc knuckle n=1 Tax=Popillia japonica TaxID=7064 RepID=A0AAW1IYP9_POPJA
MANREDQIEKLTGSENFHTWRFAMKNVLELNGWENCILPVTDENYEKDTTKLKKWKAKLVLCIDSSVYVYILGETTATGIWERLKTLYQDSGLVHKIGRLRKLPSTKLEDCDSMMSYVSQVIDTANKLNGIGFAVSEEWLGVILLTGLTDNFEPMIMGLEITGDTIKTKLFDTIGHKSNDGSAFFGKKIAKNAKPNGNTVHNPKKNVKCFKCKKRGHFANECPTKTEKVNKSNSSEGKNAFHAVLLSNSTTPNLDEWYIDSGASQHMTMDEELLHNRKQIEPRI